MPNSAKSSEKLFTNLFSYYNQFLDTEIAKRFNLRKLSEQLVYQGAKNGVKVGSNVSKFFKDISLGQPKRLTPQQQQQLFDLNYNEEQIMVKDAIHAFAQTMRLNAEKIDDNGEIPTSLWQEYYDLQLAFMQVPEVLGGVMQESSTVTQMLMVESLSYGDLGQTLALFSTNSVINAIVKWGSESQQNELLPQLLEQKNTATIAINEPTPLFSPFELNTTATKHGVNYILNGKKNMVPIALNADYCLIAAQIANNIQLFIVNADAKGVSITKDSSMGLKAASLSEITLNQVEVHESAILGGVDGCSYQEFINYCKLGWCSLAVGCCQAVLDYVIQYANDRYAFGEPISNRQAVAFMIADMKIELDGMRILTQRAASKAEQGLDFNKEVYLAHVFCSDKAMQIATNGVQLLGGHGYIKDFPVERWYRDLRAVAIAMNGLHL